MSDSSTDFEVEDGLPPWGMVPRRVMLAKLTNNDRAVYALLATYASRKTREAFPKQSVLGEALGSERTVRRSVKNLEKAGFLSMRRVKGPSGQYVRTIYKMLGWDREEVATHRPTEAIGHRPVSVEVQRPTEVNPTAYRSTDQTATDQHPAPDGAVPIPGGGRVRKDVRRAREFLERFEAWYLRVYRRPHSSPGRSQVFETDALLRKVDRDRLRVPAVNEATAEAVIGCVLTIAIRCKAQIWFLRNGEPLCLDEILSTKKWQVLWDRFLEEGQRLGWPMGEFDGQNDGTSATAA